MRYSIAGIQPDAVKSVGAKGIKTTRRVGLTFAELTAQQVADLKKQGATVTAVPKVRADVGPPIPVAATPLYTPQQLTLAIGLDELRGLTDPPLLGERFVLAILDTGIRETHELIRGKVIARHNYTTSPMGDAFNHGTGVCGLALAFVPECSIINMKVMDDTGNGTEEEVSLAIDDCIDLVDTDPANAPSVINLSLGGEDTGDPNTPIRVACRAAIEKGIWINAAAGNGGPSAGTITTPACERYVSAVGSASFDPYVVSYTSSRGPTKEGLDKPDVVFFGENIIIASSASDTATIARSGTSFSTPFMSGASILYQEMGLKWSILEFPQGPPPGFYIGTVELLPIEEVIDIHLVNVCYKPPGSPAAKDNDYGHGIPLGPLIMDYVRTGAAVGIDLGSMMSLMVSLMMVVMMMGVMTKAMR